MQAKGKTKTTPSIGGPTLLLAVLAGVLCSGAAAQSSLPSPALPDATQSTGLLIEDQTDAASDGQAFGAQFSSNPQTVSPTQDGRDRTNAPGSTGVRANANPSISDNALPAARILQILDAQPDAVVEVKSLLAEQLQQQGARIQADDITDEMMYSRIETSHDARESITGFMRVRGYLSPEDDQQEDRPRRPSQTDVTDEEDDAASLERDSLATPEAVAKERRPALASRDNAGRTSSTLEAGTTKKREEQVNSSTDEPKVLRKPAPYNLRSMRDLYTQIPEQETALKRFGSDVFVERNGGALQRSGISSGAPLDVSLGLDYVVGPGDTLAINLWGGVTQSLTRLVDSDGRILLPEAGSLNVAGLTLGRVQGLVETTLQQQYRNAQASVTVSQLRSVRVYVTGDVQRPGGYDLSALATPLSALYAAGGPTSAGSLRILRHLRGNKLLEETDLYDFLLHGLRDASVHFQSGDTILVPPAGPQIAISGAVKRPAIYEVKDSVETKAGESTLASVIADAGGYTAAASLGHITIERIDTHQQRQTVTIEATSREGAQSLDAAIKNFSLKDGDRVRISSILPYSEQAIYLEGHVVRPGREAYREGMHLSDVLRSYQDMLPEPAAHGEIVRLVAPDLHAETIAFDVPDILIGNANLGLRPFDTIRIFGRYEADAPRVTIHGEVLRPGRYPLSIGMTAAQLVRMAGGFKTDALIESADLISYDVAAGSKVVGNLHALRIGVAVNGNEPGADVPLKAGDVLTIHQITGWNDIGESVRIEGQVAFPGSYGFKEGERLSSVLRRAGGFLDSSYPAGAVLVRQQVRELEEKSREELIRQIETSSAAARLAPNVGSSDSAADLQLIQAQQDQVVARLKSQPPTGRLVVHINNEIESWTNTPEDIELRRGDVLTVPKRPGFVLVTGQVYNATALSFSPGRTAAWYLSHAGGTNGTANRKEVFVIRANGSLIGRHSGGLFDPKVLSTKLDPGDVVVVPQKIIGSSVFWRNLLATAQLASSIALTAAVVRN